MTALTCAISGIQFKTDHLTALSIPHTAGYFHPIFAASHAQLQQLYSCYCKGALNNTDSYLTFLALAHSSEQIEWKHPVTLEPNSPSTTCLIANNIRQLVSVLSLTYTIVHPSFRQPSFVVTHNNSELHQIKHWIEAWADNIENFNTYRASKSEQEELQKVENNLSLLILSGESTERYSHIVADWASIAGQFPADKKEVYKRTIRSCFNTTKMFNTPLTLLKEIKEYCECNIEAGSIHFHKLSEVLREGISRHVDYLGGSSLALGYTLLPEIGTASDLKAVIANETAIASILASAPDSAPIATDYPDNLSFLKAKLAYRTKMNSITRDKNTPENNL